MKYALVQCVNGNFSVVSEHGENIEGAIVAFHNLAAALWNAQDVRSATIKVVDENLNTVMDKSESIGHTPAEETEE